MPPAKAPLLSEAAHWPWRVRALACTLPALVLLAAMSIPPAIIYALRLVPSSAIPYLQPPTFIAVSTFLDIFALPAAVLAVPVAALVGPWLLRRGAARRFQAVWISALTGPFATSLLVIFASFPSRHPGSDAVVVATILTFGIPIGILYGLLWWALFLRYLPGVRPRKDMSGLAEGPE